MKVKAMTAGKTAGVLSTLFIGACIVASCNIQPSADFTLDKSEYDAGTVVKCRNTSTDANSYKWTFHDGQTAATKDVDYTIHSQTAPGTYSIKLEAISAKGNKVSTATKSFTVK